MWMKTGMWFSPFLFLLFLSFFWCVGASVSTGQCDQQVGKAQTVLKLICCCGQEAGEWKTKLTNKTERILLKTLKTGAKIQEKKKNSCRVFWDTWSLKSFFFSFRDVVHILFHEEHLCWKFLWGTQERKSTIWKKLTTHQLWKHYLL